jgi:N-acetylglucosaminyldiphosphoundecaprenol N-acetyl-beta-D-mannosaminyltransferase
MINGIRHPRDAFVLTTRVHVVSLPDVLTHVLTWIGAPISYTVCFANAYTCMESYDDPAFRVAVNNADLVIPDGRPLVWALHLLGASAASHIRGYDMMVALFEMAQQHHLRVGFLGGEQTDLETLCALLADHFPALKIACAISPPFRPLTPAEDASVVEQIKASGVQLLFVFLGCPKQEVWMAAHRERLSCCMFGVGAALKFYVDPRNNAPRFMQHSGLEWLFRLVNEPRRLWRRYLKHNPRFLWYFFAQWLRHR